jgi:hypothetical protein
MSKGEIAASPKKSKKKYEDYELDNHVRTMEEAGKLMGDKELMKHVHKHAKKKKNALHKVSKMLSAGEPDADDQELTSIDDIRNRRKKIKEKMLKGV